MIDLDLVYASYRASEERTLQQNIVLARNYYAGDQGSEMSKRQEAYIGEAMPNQKFAVNYCAPVVNAAVERMIVTQFTSEDQVFEAWCLDAWQHNRMDAKQRDVHQQAVNEAEAFVGVDWPDGDEFPTFTPMPRYTDVEVEGTGYGCKAHYQENDPNQELEAISKRWREVYKDEKDRDKLRERMNIYYPDRIERYVAVTEGRWRDSGWEPFADDEGEAVIPRVDLARKPLGIPIAHLRKPGTYELSNAIVPQDIINKTALDALAIADSCGFPIRFTYGWYATTDGKIPESDGSNYLTLTPGAWVGPPLKAGSELTRTEVLPPADLVPLLAALDSWILKLAQVTDTPPARFQITGQIAAEGTLKQQEGPLLAKVRAYKTQIGNGWEDVFTVCRNLGVMHGVTFSDNATVETQWEPSETRDKKVELETLEIKARLGVPQETLWSEMGYDVEQIAIMKAQSAQELEDQSNIGGALLRDFERGGVV